MAIYLGANELATGGGGGIEINQLAQFGNAPGLYINSNGQEFLKAGIITTDVDNYPDALKVKGDVTGAVYVKNFSVGSQDTSPETVAFSLDGLNMYMTGLGTNEVHQYILSTAWDIATSAYSQSKALTEYQLRGLTFADNGSKMYAVSRSAQKILEYTLSTPWDISTASFIRDLSVSSNTTTPAGISISLDGTKMFIVGSNDNKVYQYVLPTPYSLTAASFLASINVAGSPQEDIFINNSGYQMYVIAGVNINQYIMTTAYDLTTASYVQAASASPDGDPQGIWFKEDLDIMYIAGNVTDSILQYSIPPVVGIEDATGLDANTYIRIK